MVRVGIAGIGFMGWIHWLAYQQIPTAEVVAICEQNPVRRAGDWTSIRGNFGPPGEQVDLSSIETFTDLESFCGADLDLIDVCLPPAFHTDAIALAAKAGKHVFCEKPLSLKKAQCDSAVAICRQHQRILFVGHVLPYFPEYQFALEAIRGGEFGELLGCKLKRVISDPTWINDYYDPQRVGGPLLDLHVHDAHFLRLIAGMPTGVFSRGRCRGEVVSYCESIFEFGERELCATATSGVIDQPGRPFTHGYEIHLERATLQFEYAGLRTSDELMPLKVIRDDGTVSPVPIDNGDPVHAFANEIAAVVSAVRAGEPLEMLGGEFARDAIVICEAQSKSVHEHRLVATSEV